MAFISTQFSILTAPSILKNKTIYPPPDLGLLVKDVAHLEPDGNNFPLWVWQPKAMVRYVTGQNTGYLDVPLQLPASHSKLGKLIFCMITWSIHPKLRVFVNLNASARTVF